jgi:hypothetical protein
MVKNHLTFPGLEVPPNEPIEISSTAAHTEPAEVSYVQAHYGEIIAIGAFVVLGARLLWGPKKQFNAIPLETDLKQNDALNARS